MIELKNGQCTADRRLDRVRHVDLNSLNWPIRKLLPREAYRQPRSYTWPLKFWLDQGSEGACVGFGFGHELLAIPVAVKGVDNKYAREQLYWEIQKRDPWNGGAYPGATPFYEGTSVTTGAMLLKEVGFYQEVRWAFDIEDLVAAVGFWGPAVIGVDWYTGMFDTDESGYFKPTGQIEGGHCVLIIGVRVKFDAEGKLDYLRSYFTFHNSWGQDWGVNGRAKMYLIDFMKLWPGGEFCIPVRRLNKRH